MSRRSEKTYTKNSFYRRLCGIIIAIIFLGAINLLFSPDSLWIKWIIILGALAIVLDFANVFFINDRFNDE